MKSPSTAIRDLAAQILAQEACTDPLLSESAETSAFERLRLHLAKFVGLAGYHALLSRALALAATEEPSVRCVQLQPLGLLQVPESCAADETERWAQALLARQIDLLVTFVGEALTMRLIQDIWPQAKLKSSLNSQTAASGEKK